MRLLLFSTCLLVAGWVALGPHISALLDRLGTVPESVVPVTQVALDGHHLILNMRRWILPGELRVVPDSHTRLTVAMNGHSFELGPILRCTGNFYEFSPEAGDHLSFERTRSRVPWATPFAYSIMGGTRPKWHRYCYHRLVWRKANGATLEMVWRDQEDLYRMQGWAEGHLETEPHVLFGQASAS